MKHFAPNVVYIDAILGWPFYNHADLKAVLKQFMPKWPDTAKSYPTRVLGDMNSAVIEFTDTPELFGGEGRVYAAIDFKDGKIVRQVDYWDGRNFGVALAGKMRTPEDKFPKDFRDREECPYRKLIQSLVVGGRLSGLVPDVLSGRRRQASSAA